ncbi:nuclear receptor-binding protein 2 isoform X4 [Psammomys obesus]|uniref:nuclear receptor-binding protein 2 isoform X4 n=1 Tax=Psammomys obesus TaxID=48139 RepID=UPI002452E943|nr:nuclear receptor-binding protein 2 isoform X4 [Psammomys obesus]
MRRRSRPCLSSWRWWTTPTSSSCTSIGWTPLRPGRGLKQFLKKTKKNHKAMNARAWKRWCTQILSALSFLHACSPPIIHGNLTSDTIFIQHNGLIKIGSVWYRIFSNALPDDLRSPIRAEREELRNLHFFPPEYGEVNDGTAVDIFSFGMCALEMAVLEIQANGDTRVTEEAIARARHSLSDPNMREFILSCLARDPAQRPSAHNLLFHRVLFEVHSLKLLAAHCFIQHQYLMPENVVEEKTKAMDLHAVLAEMPQPHGPPMQWRYSEVSFLELDKFLEDVRNGIYPLMNFAAARPLGLPRVLAPPPEEAQKAKTPTPEPFDSETRKVVQMQCNMERSEDKARWHLTLLLVLEDRLHRQLTYDLLPTDSAQDLAAELVHYGFLHEVGRGMLRVWKGAGSAKLPNTTILPHPSTAGRPDKASSFSGDHFSQVPWDTSLTFPVLAPSRDTRAQGCPLGKEPHTAQSCLLPVFPGTEHRSR